MLEGEITVTTKDGDTVLGAMDSCHFAPNEERAVINNADRVATMLVVMPNPPKES